MTQQIAGGLILPCPQCGMTGGHTLMCPWYMSGYTGHEKTQEHPQTTITRLTEENARLKEENEKLNSYQARLATDLAAYMVGNENLKEDNQRMRAALERIAADNIGAIYPFSSTQTVAERQSDIAREELERGKE